MYSTVKYTDDTEGEAGVEDKKRYSLDIAPFDFAFFPQLKSNLH